MELSGHNLREMDDPSSRDHEEAEVIRSMQEELDNSEESQEPPSSSSPLKNVTDSTRNPRQIMARSLSSYHSMGALDIIKESVASLRNISSLFTWITFLLATPFSLVALCQPWILGSLAQTLALRLQHLVQAPGLWFYQSATFKLSDSFISHAFQLPFYIVFAIPARATVAWAVALLYSATKFNLHHFLRFAAIRVCSRAVITYLWICTLMLGCMGFILSVLLLVTTFSQATGVSPDILLLLLATMGVAFSLVFAHLVIISNLAMTMSVLEEIQGRSALMKAILVLRGRAQVGLVLFIVSTAATASIDGLFQYRVVGMPGYQYRIDVASKLWEMPLLVVMYAFLYMFDAIPSTIFYFTCKSACCEVFDRFSLPER